MYAKVFLVLFVAATVSSKPLVSEIPIWAPCDPKQVPSIGGVTITNLVIPGCTVPPCNVNRGTNATTSITFTANKGFTDLTNQVKATVLGITTTYQVPQPDVCKDGVTCPVASGQSYTESVAIPIKSVYPKVKVYLEWMIMSSAGTEACVRLELQLV